MIRNLLLASKEIQGTLTVSQCCGSQHIFNKFDICIFDKYHLFCSNPTSYSCCLHSSACICGSGGIMTCDNSTGDKISSPLKWLGILSY